MLRETGTDLKYSRAEPHSGGVPPGVGVGGGGWVGVGGGVLPVGPGFGGGGGGWVPPKHTQWVGGVGGLVGWWVGWWPGVGGNTPEL